MTLYDIDQAIAGFDFKVDEDTGEILNFDELDELNMERDRKIENVALWIKELDVEANAIKAERKALEERQQQKERKRDGLKRYLERILQGEKFETPKCSIGYRRSQSVVVGDAFMEWAALNRPDLLRTTIKTEPDKAKIKEIIKAGEKPVGASLVDKVSMQIK